MQLIPTQKNISGRQEARFFVGYAEAQITTQEYELDIELKTDKNEYQPKDLVTVEIYTKDKKQNPVEARVSLAVIDAALQAVYKNNKEPLPYFFNKI
jgi:uncharacterized protein YfaS (alpha-2-macroglobulin family)